MTARSFWDGKHVFVTGHNGFKGTWLSLWLSRLGAAVTGYSLEQEDEASVSAQIGLSELAASVKGDIADAAMLAGALRRAAPDIVFHLAAQPLVGASYADPLGTYAANVMGTANLLQAVREAVGAGVPVRAVVIVTTDKVYENREWPWGYREDDRLGGYDPYSSSKACAELVTAAYRSSYFHPDRYGGHGVAVATARAGNVIGGGDRTAGRLVPDCLGALAEGGAIVLNNPRAVRPWQHVLEPVSGYAALAERLAVHGPLYGEAWNFGPAQEDFQPVERVAALLCAAWGDGASFKLGAKPPAERFHETGHLMLDSAKSRARLDWRPVWGIGEAVQRTVAWAKASGSGADMRAFSLGQIADYESGSGYR